MLEIKFIEYYVLIVFSIFGGLITYFLITRLAKLVVGGARLKTLLMFVVTCFLIGMIYALGHGIFDNIKIGKLNVEYQKKFSEYKDIQISVFNESKNILIKNELLYAFNKENKYGNLCNDLKNGLNNELKEEVAKIDFDKTDFYKKSKEICKINYKYIEIEEKDNCATKKSGVFCWIVNPLIGEYKFESRSFDPPIEDKAKNIGENPLDIDEPFSKKDEEWLLDAKINEKASAEEKKETK